jgi:hypothetical protein
MTSKEYLEYISSSKKGDKYNNTKTEVDGITFDSEVEAMRYAELKTLEKAGVISELERQKKFELQPAFYYQGRKQRPIYYVCDFYYREGDKYIIEDVKSPITRNNQVYKLKKKIMMYKGYEVRET